MFTVTSAIIEVENLTKRYGDVQALRGVSFAVQEGEVFGLLGPNGAGKTSTVEILEGLRPADGGRVQRLRPGPANAAATPSNRRSEPYCNPRRCPTRSASEEALSVFASFYSHRRDTSGLLKRFGLEEKRRAFYSQLSGGQKQRLALAMSLVNDPSVIFLDEPTAGLDPQVRREIYDIVEELKKERKTILLTTHYIEEAERLCDRVAIVDQGLVIAQGTPRELKQGSAGTTRIELRLARPEPDGALAKLEGRRGLPALPTECISCIRAGCRRRLFRW